MKHEFSSELNMITRYYNFALNIWDSRVQPNFTSLQLYIGVLAISISSLHLIPTLLYSAHWPWSMKRHVSALLNVGFLVHCFNRKN